MNVVKGDMSLVGTRPPTLEEWERYDLAHRARMSIKPGMSCYWQTRRNRDSISFDEWVDLDLYKSRDASEKLFSGSKSFLGGKALRVHSGESVAGRLFVEFAAMILRNAMHVALDARMEEAGGKANFMTVPAAVAELEKIEVVRQADGIYRLDHAVTATQREIGLATLFGTLFAASSREAVQSSPSSRGASRPCRGCSAPGTES